MLTSLSIHAIPMTLMCHIRWVTMPMQAHLPEDQQRFGSGSLVEETWSAYLYQQFVLPFAFYSAWLVFYGLVNFVLAAERIKRRNYDSTFKYMKNKPGVK
jgi:hypothetical protein